jgi:hypothetical protein
LGSMIRAKREGENGAGKEKMDEEGGKEPT